MLRVQITNKSERRQLEHPGGPLEFGRGPRRESARCVLEDPFVSGDQLRVSETTDGKIQLNNLSGRNAVTLGEKTSIAPGGALEVNLPVRLVVGKTLIEISRVLGSRPGPLESGLGGDIARESLMTIARPRSRINMSDPAPSLPRLSDAPGAETLTQWFETVVNVQRAAASSAEFYDHTARAVVDLVGLDLGLVLLERQGDWEAIGKYSRDGDEAVGFSRTILKYVTAERRTFFQALKGAEQAGSLMEVEAVVASPVFDAAGEKVVGAVYGSRRHGSGGLAAAIRPLEAQLVQVLAAAVGAGLARLEQEAEASRRHVQFEQFFSSVLAQELDRDPSMLEGREREVTILFSDIRNFSRLSEKLGPSRTCQLVGDVMERLTARIRDHDGVVVDYMGDGLLAMWNAPADQPEHAALACRAALAMVGELPGLSADWRAVLGAPLGLGVGINTGMALVGNTGSQRKFKYGPLGHTVNLASRVEGATKQLGVPILITGSTRGKVSDAFATRRLCRVRVVGIAGAVELYELGGETPGAEWLARRDAYEQALALYENGKWVEASRALYPLLPEGDEGYDVPSLALLGRAIDCLKKPPDGFDPVFELQSK